MGKFKVGQVVVPLSNPFNKYSQKRKIGEPCEVTEVRFCSKKGHQLLNLNGNKALKEAGGFFGCVCGELHLDDGLAWTSSDEFVLGSNMKEALQNALDIEDYDTAIKLRDLKL